MPIPFLRYRLALTIGAALAAVIVACGTTTPDVAPLGADAGAFDGGAPDAAPDTGACCAPDPRPGCCMNYGGAAGTCARTCDSMPVPSDPGWKLGTDEHGCAVWTNPNDFFVGHGTYNPSTSYCGVPPTDDAGVDAKASDAATD